MGDQARAALWAAVAVLSGAGVLAEGGLNIPAVLVAAALAWGLMPHVLAQRAGRVHGRFVAGAFLAAVVVAGLHRRLRDPGTLLNLSGARGDAAMHLFCGLALTAVSIGPGRGRRAWWVGASAAVAGGVLSAGELVQRYFSTRSPQWSDVGWDLVGAGAGACGYLLVAGLRRLERLLPQPGRAGQRKYDPWAAVGGL